MPIAGKVHRLVDGLAADPSVDGEVAMCLMGDK